MSNLRIVHLSDPHFGTILPGVQEALVGCVKELSPGLVILTGDITQRARGREFRAARGFVESLGTVPFIGLPGNHDIPLTNLLRRIFRPYEGYKRLFVNYLEKDHHHGDVRVTGLASTSRWRHVQGNLNLNHVQDRLVQQGKQSKAKVHIVAFHHPMDCRQHQDEKNLLKGREGAIELFERNGVDLIIGGHIHDPFLSLSTERYPFSKRAMILGVAGTCLSSRTRSGASNSFYVVDVDTKGLPQITIGKFELNSKLQFIQTRVTGYDRDQFGNWRLSASS